MTEAVHIGAARTTVRNAAAIAAARIISSGVLFGWQIALGRLLGDADFGVYSAVGGLFSIAAAFAGFSMSRVVIREVARRPADAPPIAAAALVIATCAALVAFLGMNAAATGFPAEVRALAALAALSLFADTAGTLAYDQLLAREQMVVTSVVEVGHLLVRIGLALGVLALGFGLPGVYAVTVLTGTARAGVLWWAAARAGARPRFPVDAGVRRMLLVGSLPLVISAAISVTYTQIDKLLAAATLGFEETGHYNAALILIIGVVEVVNMTVLIALYPAMARAADTPAFTAIVRALAGLTLLVGVPIGLVFTAYGPLITAVFGPGFAPAGPIVQVLIWYAVVTMCVNVFDQALLAQNRPRRIVALRAFGLALKLALNLVFLPAFGVVGAAVTSVLAEAVVLALAGHGFVGRESAARAARLCTAFVLSAAALGVGGLLHPIAGVAAGLLCYAAAVLGLRVLGAGEWALVNTLAAALPGGQAVLGRIPAAWRG
jgi:O-antigen/teichoic acid export membrane protein